MTLDHPDLESRLKKQREQILKKIQKDPTLREKILQAKKTRASSRPISIAVYREMLKMEACAEPDCPAKDGSGPCSCGEADDEAREG